MSSLARARRKLDEYFVDVFAQHPQLITVTLIAVAGQIGIGGINYFTFPFYILDTLGQSGAVLGYLSAAYFIVESLLRLPLGYVSDRVGQRPMIFLGLLGLAALPVVATLVPPYVFIAAPALIWAVLLPLRMAGGAGVGAFWPATLAGAAGVVPEEQRATGLAATNVAYALGIAGGPALAGFIGGALGYGGWNVRAAFALSAAAFGLAIILSLFLPAPRRQRAPRLLQRRGILPVWAIALILAITVFEFTATSTLAPYLAPYLTRVAHVPRSQVGYYLLLLGVPVILLGLPLGRLADRWPRRTSQQLGLWIATVGMWGMAYANSRWWIAIAGGTITVGFLLGIPAWEALITELAPAGREGFMMSVVVTMQGVGGIFGPMVGGYLWDVRPSYTFVAAAGSITLSALLALLLSGQSWAAVERRAKYRRRREQRRRQGEA
jgi:DHA1 family multidrug resistance protein-like MFS transporter